MDVKTLFPSLVITENLEVDNQALVDFSYKLTETEPSELKSNEGGYQSKSLQDAPELQPLLAQINNVLNNVHKEFGFKGSLEVKSCWININGPGNFNKPHIHPGAFFSGVYYVKAEKFAGALEILNPINGHPYSITEDAIETKNMYSTDRHWEQPEAGKLVIFSPWLEHFVQPNHSGSDRISIAFNSYIV